MTGTPASKACARIVAKHIMTSHKLGADEHNRILKDLDDLRDAHPEFKEEIRERNVWLANRSAASKDLAKAGLVSEGQPSAFVNEIAEAVDALAVEVANAAKEFEK